MARPIKTSNKNINVFQSYVLTTAKYQFSVYEKRILYRLVEFAQQTIKDASNGGLLKMNMRPLYSQNLLDGGLELGFYISDILDVYSEDNPAKHYERVKEAFKNLSKKTIEWEDTSKDTWRCTTFVYNIELTKRQGFVKFQISKWFWNIILDFTKGYRKYELLTAMKLKSPYSMRFYELMSGQKKPITYSVEQLREMFGLEDKYKRPSSIIKRVIEPAKKELDSAAPYSFNFKEQRQRTGKTSPIIGFVFTPIFDEDKQDKELQRIERQSKLTSRILYNDSLTHTILRCDFNFTIKEMNSNKETILKGKEIIPDWIGFLYKLKDSQGYKNAENKKGYVIQAIKRKTKEEKEKREQPEEEPF